MPRNSKDPSVKDNYCKSSLEIHREAYIPIIAGESDKNFATIKGILKKDIIFVPGEKKIDVYAPDQKTADQTVEVLRSLKQILQNKRKGDNKSFSNTDIQAAMRNASPSAADSMSVSDTYPVTPRNPKQATYMDVQARHNLVVGIGPAGTGKTFISIAMACRALANKLVKKIILTRPLVEAGESLGTLPGGVKEKMHERLVPLYESLIKIMGKANYEMAEKAGKIEIVPISQARGRTFNDAFIVVDEAQNTTIEQMKMLLTRIGESATMVINGDITQCDLPRNWKTGEQIPSGLNDALEVLSEHFLSGEFALVAFDEKEVVRSRTASLVVQSYVARDKKKQQEQQPR